MSANVNLVCPVEFPDPTGLNVNMLPILMGDWESVPAPCRRYVPLIERCRLRPGSTVYLSVSEGLVEAGETQRRPGIHTEATSGLGWGGGGWGSTEPELGVYMASTDGACRVWDTQVMTDHPHGEVPRPASEWFDMEPSVLYWLTDRTPHEALPAACRHYRQWFRLVADAIDGWWYEHSTPNPLVRPNAPILKGSKFA